MLPEIDQTIFNQNLLLTQAYCELQLQKHFESNAKVLRSINPIFDGRELFAFNDDGPQLYTATKWNTDLSGKYLSGNFTKVFENQMAFKSEKVKEVDKNKIYKGKILLTEIERVLPDGASEYWTEGFIDEIDWPPIDTWFYKAYNREGLVVLSWIPEAFVDITEEGIAVNALDVLYWYNGERLLEHQPQYGKISSISAGTGQFSQSIVKSFFNFFRS
ncbi:hypothetical protein GCM10028827_33450 [Mucilaginibacter myungsuensis]